MKISLIIFMIFAGGATSTETTVDSMRACSAAAGDIVGQGAKGGDLVLISVLCINRETGEIWYKK